MAFNWFKKNKGSVAAEHDVTGHTSVDPKLRHEENASGGLPPEAPAPAVVETSDGLMQTKAHAYPGETVAASEKKGLLARLKTGLAKTRQILTTDIEDLFRGRQRFDEDMLEELEELLITSDIGVRTTGDLIGAISRKTSRITGAQGLKDVLRDEILSLLETAAPPESAQPAAKPRVTMVVGVNGVGKTTTIGKLAALGVRQGESLLISAADTFRAAAIEQLAIWAERAGADFVHHQANADPAAVAYDSIMAARTRNIDWVLVDTAGRLHTKVNLMEELKKIKRTIAKIIPDAPHEVLLVLDATTGQNAISQARLFDQSLGVTGLVLTKLDGTAKGGVIVSICRELSLPIKYIGVGEAIEDLQPFNARQYVEALF